MTELSKRLASMAAPTLDLLRDRSPEFTTFRKEGVVTISLNGNVVGLIEVADGSGTHGINFQSKRPFGGTALPMVFARADKTERKRVAYVCAFISYLFDRRPSEERAKGVDPQADPKRWFSKFDRNKHVGDQEAFYLQRDFIDACQSTIDIFHDVGDAVRSARREDVRESLERVQKELPLLTNKLSEEEWLLLYREHVVDEVHSL